jgi:hypothetical protein
MAIVSSSRFRQFQNSIKNKIDYVHNNPDRAGLVRNPDEFIYNSAIVEQERDWCR